MCQMRAIREIARKKKERRCFENIYIFETSIYFFVRMIFQPYIDLPHLDTYIQPWMIALSFAFQKHVLRLRVVATHST